MALYNWSTTAASNATADPSVNWAEGQAPSSVNDSARAMMAAVAKWRDDMGCNLQAFGTSTAYTLTTNQVFDTLANMATKEITFFAPATNGDNPTLNVDGLGAKLIVTVATGTGIPAGTLIAGGIYSVTYSNAFGQFVLRGFCGNPFNVPIGAGMDYWGATVPNSNFAFANGAAISRTTYAALFAIMGTTYGAGDGSTTFNLPDKSGRVTAGRESSASRLTSSYFGGDSTALGATGGLERHALTTAQLPAVTPAGTISSVTAAGTNSAVTAAGTISSVTAAGTISGVTAAGTISAITPSGTVSSITPSGTISAITPAGTISQITPAGTITDGTITISGGTKGAVAGTTAVAAGGHAFADVGSDISASQSGSTFSGTPVTPTFTGSSVTPTFTGSASAAPTFTGNAVTPTFSGTTVTPTFSGSAITPTFTGSSATPIFSGTTVTPTFTGTSFGGGQSHPVVQPTIICNYIIRIA